MNYWHPYIITFFWETTIANSNDIASCSKGEKNRRASDFIIKKSQSIICSFFLIAIPNQFSHFIHFFHLSHFSLSLFFCLFLDFMCVMKKKTHCLDHTLNVLLVNWLNVGKWSMFFICDFRTQKTLHHLITCMCILSENKQKTFIAINKCGKSFDN